MAELTESLEDYLEAIAELIEIEGHAHAKEIAEKLHVKMPSVTGALRQLAKKNFITYSTHFPVQLTPEGKAIAERVIQRHTNLKNFFALILGLPVDKAEETACRIEHVVDEETVRRFVLFSQSIEKRRDARSLQTYLTEALAHVADGSDGDFCVLTELKPGEKGTVSELGRNIASADDLPVKVGDPVEMTGFSLDRSICLFNSGDRSCQLASDLAENLWVHRIKI